MKIEDNKEYVIYNPEYDFIGICDEVYPPLGCLPSVWLGLMKANGIKFRARAFVSNYEVISEGWEFIGEL